MIWQQIDGLTNREVALVVACAFVMGLVLGAAFLNLVAAVQ